MALSLISLMPIQMATSALEGSTMSLRTGWPYALYCATWLTSETVKLWCRGVLAAWNVSRVENNGSNSKHSRTVPRKYLPPRKQNPTAVLYSLTEKLTLLLSHILLGTQPNSGHLLQLRSASDGYQYSVELDEQGMLFANLILHNLVS